MGKWCYISLAIGVVIIAVAMVPNPVSYAQVDLSGAKLAPEEKAEIMAQAEASKKTPDKAYLLIYSDVIWSATVLDSELDSFTQDGSKNSEIEFECVPGSMSVYSLNVQKNSEAGNLLLILIQNGNLLDAARTQAAYGLASLSGNCGTAEDINVYDLITSTQLQREKEETEQRALEEEMQKRKEAGYRQTNETVIAQLMFKDKCSSLKLE